MTGKDLIIYILQNDLESAAVDEIVSKVILNEHQLAAKFQVSIDTIRTWQKLKKIDGIEIGGLIFYYVNTSDPRGVFR